MIGRVFVTLESQSGDAPFGIGIITPFIHLSGRIEYLIVILQRACRVFISSGDFIISGVVMLDSPPAFVGICDMCARNSVSVHGSIKWLYISGSVGCFE